MSNITNYATQFERDLKQKYTREGVSSKLLTPNVQFVNANTVRLPYILLKGYKDHDRNGDFNRQVLENRWITKVLAHDRDVEFKVDTMDVDETNLVLSVANITNTFETEHAIPERDAYVFSKLYSEFVDPTVGNKVADTTVITAANILDELDKINMDMTDKEVPLQGRLLYVTPAIKRILKNAEGIQRHLNATEGRVNRNIDFLDDLEIIEVPSARFKTAYDFSDGYAPAVTATQINFILVHPQTVLYGNKHSYIHMFAPGSDSRTADSYLYQNRAYWDAFLINTRIDGIYFNIAA